MAETSQHRIALIDEPDKIVELVIGAVWDLDPHVAVGNESLQAARDATLVLYDAPAWGNAGRDALAAHARSCRAPIAVFTATPCVDHALEYLRLGACGYLSKDAMPAQLAASLEHLLSGRCTIDPTVAGLLARTVAANPRQTWSGMTEGLTRREGEVFDLMRRGFSNRGIADELVIGMQTVKSHVHRIHHKLGVQGRGDILE